jgi:hypothetical protein
MPMIPVTTGIATAAQTPLSGIGVAPPPYPIDRFISGLPEGYPYYISPEQSRQAPVWLDLGSYSLMPFENMLMDRLTSGYHVVCVVTALRSASLRRVRA